jgi:hypothetical protein
MGQHIKIRYISRVQEGLHGDSATGVQYASVCCSLPSPQCGHLAPGEGQSLPSAPHSMESCQLWVIRSILEYSISVQEGLHGDSATGVQATSVCCSPPPHSVGSQPLVRGRPGHVLHTLWNQANYKSAEAS